MPWDIPAGIIQTVVGTGEAGYSGDGGPAAAAGRRRRRCCGNPSCARLTRLSANPLPGIILREQTDDSRSD